MVGRSRKAGPGALQSQTTRGPLGGRLLPGQVWQGADHSRVPCSTALVRIRLTGGKPLANPRPGLKAIASFGHA